MRTINRPQEKRERISDSRFGGMLQHSLSRNTDKIIYVVILLSFINVTFSKIGSTDFTSGYGIYFVSPGAQPESKSKTVEPLDRVGWQPGNKDLRQVEEITASPNPEKETLIVLLCNEKYCRATASLISSLQSDGGYTDDIAVIIDESTNYTRESLERDIFRDREGGDLAKEMANIFLWTSEELFDSLQLSEQGIDFLRETPPFSSCVAMNETNEKITAERRKRAYYLKSLMFHPIVLNWKRVLYMDSCMTIGSPHIHEIFLLPEVEGQLLASPDPWRWRRRGIVGKFLNECPDSKGILEDGGTPNRTYEYSREEDIQLVKTLVGRNDLNNVRYFASGFILFDTSIIREHGNSSATTVIDLMSLYQDLGRLFFGDQEIFSIYWAYIRKQFRVLPLATFESNRVPYEFIKRIPADPHIVTAGHTSREVCTLRMTNNLN